MNFKHQILILCSLFVFHSCFNENLEENKTHTDVNPNEIITQHIQLDSIDKRKKSIDYFFDKRRKINLFNGNILFAEKGKIITEINWNG